MTANPAGAKPYIPSWLRWPPNCCESCVGWQRHEAEKWVGVCNSSDSIEPGMTTDSRFRCSAFKRKDGI